LYLPELALTPKYLMEGGRGVTMMMTMGVDVKFDENQIGAKST
jgi:hypothetical protein